MNLRTLRTFVAAARSGSFSRAGEQLGLTQSAVSLQIRKLEETLGCQLFERVGKSVRLSAEGRRRLPQAQALLDDYEALRRGDAQSTAPSALLRLGAISTVQQELLPLALRSAGLALHDMRLEVEPGTSPQLLAAVDARELDAAVLVRPRLGLSEDLRWFTLLKERFVAIAPAGAPNDLRELLRQLPFLRYARRSHGGQLVEQFLQQRRLWVDDRVELDEPAVLLRMVAAGLGCSIVPGGLLRPQQARGVRVLPLPGRAPQREIGLLTQRSALKQPALKALLEGLRQAAAQFVPA